MNEYASLAVQIAAGIGLAACAGLRAFLPLFVTGAAARLGWITLGDHFAWLSSWPALVIFGVAVVTEMLGDKIPVVDHALDVLQALLKPAAGAILVAAVVTDLTPLQSVVLGIIAGGSAAGLFHLAKAKVRLASTIFSGGLANPLISLAEDALSLVGTVLALVVPLLMLATLLGSLLVVGLFLLLRNPGAAGE